MRGPERQAPVHPLRRPATPKRAPGADVPDTDEAPRAPRLDGNGQPFVTLAQFLKAQGVADTGGAAKHLVRAGGILVNGQPEDRPGRKLHGGDRVRVAGKDLQPVVIDAPGDLLDP
jgi:ribosome-associated protein